jgi:Na+/H+ antiporter NhaB
MQAWSDNNNKQAMSSFLPFLKRHTVVFSVLSLAVAMPSMYLLYLYLKRIHHSRDQDQEQNLRERRRQKLAELRGKLVSAGRNCVHLIA